MEIITYNELEHKIKNNKMIYVKQVRYTLKFLKLDSVGKKTDIIKRLYDNYKSNLYYEKHIEEIIKFQRKIKNKIKNRCVNIEDFYTLEKLTEINDDYFFSYKDINNFRYGFDIRSLKKLISKTKMNPYTMIIIPPETISNIYKQLELLESKSIQTDIIEIIPVINKSELIKNKILDLFQDIDTLNIIACGTNIDWFLDLTFYKLKKMYRGLEDIWNYRLLITQEDKRKIVPNNNMFKYNMNYIVNMEYLPENYNKLQNILIEEMNKLINSGISVDYRKTGSYYVLIALTEVSEPCAQSIPWLVN